MSIKKYLVLAAASSAVLGAVSAYAGGPDVMCPPEENKMFVYVELGGGYAWQNWGEFLKAVQTGYASNASISQNHAGGGIAVADAGFQFLNHWAAEVGGMYLPRVKGSNSIDAAGNTLTSTLKTYTVMYYGALRISTPVPYVDGLEGFAKAGVGFRGVFGGGPGTVRPWKSYRTVVSPVFGVGAKYTFWGTGFSANTQFMYLPSYTRGNRNNINATSNKLAKNIPAVYALTAGVGYQFEF